MDDKQEKINRLRWLYTMIREYKAEAEDLAKELDDIEDEEILNTFAN